MGKKQHQSDKLHLSAKEWKEEWGGYKQAATGTAFKRLPFHCCAITFTPFEDPVCTDDGTVYDVVNVVRAAPVLPHLLRPCSQPAACRLRHAQAVLHAL